MKSNVEWTKSNVSCTTWHFAAKLFPPRSGFEWKLIKERNAQKRGLGSEELLLQHPILQGNSFQLQIICHVTSNVDSVLGHKANLMYLIGQDKVGKHALITLDQTMIIPLLNVSQLVTFPQGEEGVLSVFV